MAKEFFSSQKNLLLNFFSAASLLKTNLFFSKKKSNSINFSFLDSFMLHFVSLWNFLFFSIFLCSSVKIIFEEFDIENQYSDSLWIFFLKKSLEKSFISKTKKLFFLQKERKKYSKIKFFWRFFFRDWIKKKFSILRQNHLQKKFLFNLVKRKMKTIINGRRHL